MFRDAADGALPAPRATSNDPRGVVHELAMFAYLGWMIGEGFCPTREELRPALSEVLREGVVLTCRYRCRVEAHVDGGLLWSEARFDFPKAVGELMVNLHAQVVAAARLEPEELRFGRSMVEHMIANGEQGVLHVEL